VTLLSHSIFQDVIHPPAANDDDDSGRVLKLRRLKRYVPPLDLVFRETAIIVFDLETTGLDHEADRIIEIGAHKLLGGKLVDQFEALVRTDVERTEQNIQLTGITSEMLADQPAIEEVLPRFLDFIEGGILVAHNAEFDIGMIRAAASRLGIDIEWPCFCTLKMAQKLLPDLERRNLDTLAERYGLTFEARHRAIGDIKVLTGVLSAMLGAEARHLTTWGSLKDFAT
jgi:DNA polymerase III epsilon subunit family exonuclease